VILAVTVWLGWLCWKPDQVNSSRNIPFDLSARLDSLRQTVETVSARRKIEADQKAVELRQKKADDWRRVKTDYPEIAESIGLISEVFGKPELVLIKDQDEVILDSRTYDPLHDANKRRR